jgi:hypothetical protein
MSTTTDVFADVDRMDAKAFASYGRRRGRRHGSRDRDALRVALRCRATREESASL